MSHQLSAVGLLIPLTAAAMGCGGSQPASQPAAQPPQLRTDGLYVADLGEKRQYLRFARSGRLDGDVRRGAGQGRHLDRRRGKPRSRNEALTSSTASG